MQDARNNLNDTLRAQLADMEAQLAEARSALETLRAARMTVEHADTAGASSSQSVPDLEVASLRAQLAVVEARAEEAEHNLSARSDELQSALTRETSIRAEVTDLSQQLSRLRIQASQRDTDLPRDAAELRLRLSLEREDRERERARLAEEHREERRHWEEECNRWSQECERLMQQSVDARTSLAVSERLRQAAEDRYRHGRERAREQGRSNAYSGSLIASSSQYKRNVQEARAAQGSTGSRASMRPLAPRSAADSGEAESSRWQRMLTRVTGLQREVTGIRLFCYVLLTFLFDDVRPFGHSMMMYSGLAPLLAIFFLLDFENKCRNPAWSLLRRRAERRGTNIFCKGSVDTTIPGVDTMVQNKGRNVKKSPSQVDTSPEQVDTTSSQVDTRDLFQGTVLQVWDSVSTHLLGRSTHSGISVT
ncbi:hypothetical protein Taro_029588 [Colocasia esculenta]|uniref:Uncharacterized protein n=1 Tax=Colocasia esculenta TaxID=4460 RepID=A0A843VJA6_COLES|nr:hypothetical protein [Colocasia esculenta]